MGLFSTLINTYITRHGQWSSFAVVATVVMVLCLVLAGIMSILCEVRIYNLKWRADVLRPKGAYARRS